jgi:hypothetical protein
MLNFVGHGKFRVDPYFGKDMIWQKK